MNVVSLFCGAGGLDLGFVQAGHRIVWSNDIYPDAVSTYRRNLGDHVVCGDITKIQSSDIPDCDIVVGGFPCQGFSVANMKRHVGDSRNVLYRELLRVIRDKRPSFFLAENVKGLLHFDGGRAFRQILDDFSRVGYRVVHQLFNAADFGVPQRRERVIIVGMRGDVSLDFAFPSPTHAREGLGGLRPWTGVADALSSLPDPDSPNDVPNHVYSKYKLNFNGYLGHRPLDPKLPAPTVTARGDDRGGVVILPHPNAKRRMTGRELATIQGFPIDFRFEGNLSSVYRQIGNAVPPPLARAIAECFPKRRPA